MKTLSFTHLPLFETAAAPASLQVRTAKEQLIANIVAACRVPDVEGKRLGKRLALTANTARWTETDLHALLKKREDKEIRNYAAFVSWTCKVVRAA